MENKSVKVSIITPSFNQGQFIEKTIQSVLNQTYKNIEYFIYDACSTDDTVNILKKYVNSVDKIIIEKDNGQSDAINKGFKSCTGELVAWINSDDILYDNCVELIVKSYLKNQNASIIYNSKCDIIDENDNKIRLLNRPIANKKFLLSRSFEVLQPGSFYNSKILKKVNYLDDTIHYCMDLDLWLKLLNYGPIIDIGLGPLCGYREWELTKTNTGAHKFYREIYFVLIRNGSSLLSKSLNKALLLFFKNKIKQFIKV